MKRISIILLIMSSVVTCLAQQSTGQKKVNAEDKPVFPGADERTPSRSEYFNWINNTNEGATEKQTLINLDFFKWLHDEYGMQLDIYAFDAGNVDGAGFYGSMGSKRFKSQFPQGFAPIAQKARSMNTSLGLWGGPDGFGNTPEEARQRTDMMVSLVRDYNFALFKMDGVCGPLRQEKQDDFCRMMEQCRSYNPNLILLNHRLDLGKGMKYSTTYLLGGAETYIDVHTSNPVTAPHHRVGALSRELTPNLTRLTEDHGVCLSSCLDYWEDDLVLQAFNRNLAVSPEIYGNPWLLRDDEYPKLARLFNLARKYRDIMVNGMVLPENEYGPNAVSRGDASTRLVTFRNLSWNPVKYTVTVDQSIGLTRKGKVQVKQYHPTEKILGEYAYGSRVEVEVLPFRSCLIKVTTAKDNEKSVEGCDYEVVRDVEGKPMEVKLLGMPGDQCRIKLTGDYSQYKLAELDGASQSTLLKGKELNIQFPGKPYKENYHRKLGDMAECPIPANARALYEATSFAADNNALEVRSLERSGPTKIPQVQAARDAFFNQSLFKERGLSDQNLFDGDATTCFSVYSRWPHPFVAGAFRLDLGSVVQPDSLVITTPDDFSYGPWAMDQGIEAVVSEDLETWKSVIFLIGKRTVIDLEKAGPLRYLEFPKAPIRIGEVTGYKNGKPIDRSNWHASNLFKSYNYRSFYYDYTGFAPAKAWSHSFKLGEVPDGSYLCIAINGTHGEEGAYAAITVDGKPVGCPDRSPSYQSEVWEYVVAPTDRNYTYYVPLTKDMAGKEIKAYVLGVDEKAELKPEVWATAHPAPYKSIWLKIK